MNEQIRQLMIEAGYPAPEIAKRAHKLVDLILFECIKIAVFKGDATTGAVIKQHFVLDDALVMPAAMMSDKGYELSTHEKQAEFATARNYILGETND